MTAETQEEIDLRAVLEDPIYETDYYAVGVFMTVGPQLTGYYVVINKEHKVVEFADSVYPTTLNWVTKATQELSDIQKRQYAKENKTAIHVQ